MVAKDTSNSAEDSPGSFRRPLMTFGIGVAVLGGLVGVLLIGSSFLAPDHGRAAGVTIALAPPAAAESEHVAQKFSLTEPRAPGGQLTADPALVEDSPFGPLPVIAADGRSPMTAYARPFEAKDKRPRIAIVVGGLNVSVTNTK